MDCQARVLLANTGFFHVLFRELLETLFPAGPSVRDACLGIFLRQKQRQGIESYLLCLFSMANNKG